MNYDYLIFHTIDFVYQTQISILFNLFTLSINLYKQSTCIQCFFFFPCVLYFQLSMPIKLPVIQSFFSCCSCSSRYDYIILKNLVTNLTTT